MSNNQAPTTREMHLKRKVMWDASMLNHARYMDANTQLFSDKYLEKRDCPACGSADDRQLFHKSGGTYVACNKCKMVYLNPVLKDDALEDYYRNNHQLQGAVVAADFEFYSRLYLKGLAAAGKQVGSLGRILDVGCSTGGFLDIAKSAGWECHGLELNHEEAAIAKSKGHAVQESHLSKATFSEPFDVISLWDVFEHIKDGQSFLLDARKYLRPSGVVLVQSPSRDSLAAKILQAHCNMFDGLEHVNLFGLDSLRMLCDRAGYEVVSYETVIAELGVVNNYLEYENPYLGFTINSKDLFGVVDEAWILEHNAGYKFQACLRIK
jgi:SAM-dependent methyltransferase